MQYPALQSKFLVLCLAGWSLAQRDVANETAKVCEMQLQATSGYVQRTGDYDIVAASDSAVWPAATFVITPKSDSRLYSRDNGDRCGFDSHLQCWNSSTTIVDATEGFYVGTNDSLFYADQSVFWLCPGDDGSLDAPYILPPIGTGSVSDYTSCNATNLTATSCKNQTQYTIAAVTAASPTANVDTATSTATPNASGRNQDIPNSLVAGAALLMIGALMACL